MRLAKRITAGVAGATLLLAGGCGESKPSVDTSTEMATVKGVVRLDGKPASEGEIVYEATNYLRPVPQNTAPINKDGTYEIKTQVGSNTIRVGGNLAKKYPILGYKQLSLDVKRGDNTFDVEMPTK